MNRTAKNIFLSFAIAIAVFAVLAFVIAVMTLLQNYIGGILGFTIGIGLPALCAVAFVIYNAIKNDE